MATERRRPYTQTQIDKGKCFRCGDQARFQWNACADGNIWRLLCAKCDLELNAIVLRWLGFKNWISKVRAYARSIGVKWSGPTSTKEN